MLEGYILKKAINEGIRVITLVRRNFGGDKPSNPSLSFYLSREKN